jgi:tRNA (guanine37-N1)-methyltransferase
MKITIISIFPDMFSSPLSYGVLKIAQDKGALEVSLLDLRDFTDDVHRQVDDIPYGGGPGMVMKPEPFFKAVNHVNHEKGDPVILMTPQGRPLNQKLVDDLASFKHIIILCPRYEGIDERVRTHLVSHEISIGDYILSGGEIPAMVLVDSITRKLEGVLGSAESLTEESFASNTLEYPQYTRPSEYQGLKVPNILLSGNHGEIKKWRDQQALDRTAKRRPDLLKK